MRSAITEGTPCGPDQDGFQRRGQLIGDVENEVGTRVDRLARLRLTTAPGSTIGGGAVEVEDAVGAVQGDCAVGGEGEVPATFVDKVMVHGAEREQIGQLGGAAAFPPHDVVNTAPVEAGVASRKRASAVHRPERLSLLAGCQPPAAADSETVAEVVEQDTDEVTVASETANGVNVERFSAGRLTRRVAVDPDA
jgi:hypothetical protein